MDGLPAEHGIKRIGKLIEQIQKQEAEKKKKQIKTDLENQNHWLPVMSVVMNMLIQYINFIISFFYLVFLRGGMMLGSLLWPYDGW